LELTSMLKSAAPGTGYDEVLVAGEPEIRKEAERRREGIPLADDTWEMLLGWGQKLGLSWV
jgi:hydroxycarboxylate dehydrogenase B